MVNEAVRNAGGEPVSYCARCLPGLMHSATRLNNEGVRANSTSVIRERRLAVSEALSRHVHAQALSRKHARCMRLLLGFRLLLHCVAMAKQVFCFGPVLLTDSTANCLVSPLPGRVSAS